ncbi:MAG: CDP-glycerol glycerophosphotransferase family protein [Candidatus Andersenbacteria bacterium]|nr:CDP-glycerol glycerophosphotransferase family protein [Candidatus Andersenbacteria bacterium]MBI3250271.1 CDP-glycerol glycerophosphotransferase family protein [Candidatus Andersenbacteria bacterium]
MKLLFSVPTGYHLRELVLPLRQYIENDSDITGVYIVTPAAAVAQEIFSDFSSKFSYYENPKDMAGHEKLLQHLAPDIVITDTVGHDELDYPLLKSAGALQISTLTFIASWDNVWKIGRLMQNKKPIHIADHLIVWNTMMKSHLLRLIPSVREDQVIVIGAPRLDYFSHDDHIPSKDALFQYLGFTDTSLPLLHFATTELYPLDYVVEAVIAAMQRGNIPRSHLYASVHPGGNMKKHQKLQQLGVTVRFSFGRKDPAPHPAFAYRPTQEDIYMLVALFKHTNVLINHSSSVALESMLAGQPVINITYGAPFDWIRWKRSPVSHDFKEHYVDVLADNGTYVANNKKELIKAIDRALQNPKEKQAAVTSTLQRMVTTTDGTASKKVLAEIKKYVS